MKLVTIVCKPFKFEEVRAALNTLGIIGYTITEVKGVGRQRGHTEIYKGSEVTVDLLPKMKIEVVVEAGRVDTVIRFVTEAARTGKIGDGKIWVTDVERFVRIRTGEGESAAL